MVSLNGRGRSVTSASVRRNRATVSPRATSAPGRISLNKENIMKMTKTEAREALRYTTPMTFYRKGRMGLTLFALLLIIATRPVGAFVNFAGAAGYGPGKTLGAPLTNRNKHWFSAFKLKEKSAATQVAQQSALLTTAIATRSGTATTAMAVSQFTSTVYGQFMLSMFIVAYIISRILQYGEARMERQSKKEQLSLIEKQMAQQTRMLQMILNSRNGRPAIAANRIGQLALANH